MHVLQLPLLNALCDVGREVLPQLSSRTHLQSVLMAAAIERLRWLQEELLHQEFSCPDPEMPENKVWAVSRLSHAPAATR